MTKCRRDLLVVGLKIPKVMNGRETEAHKLAISTAQNHNTKTWMQRWLFLFRDCACVFHIPYRNTSYTHSYTLSCTYEKAYNVTSITLYGSVFILCLCRNTFIRLHCLSQVIHSYNRAQIFRIEHLYVTNCSRLLLLLPLTLLLLLLLLLLLDAALRGGLYLTNVKRCLEQMMFSMQLKKPREKE